MKVNVCLGKQTRMQISSCITMCLTCMYVILLWEQDEGGPYWQISSPSLQSWHIQDPLGRVKTPAHAWCMKLRQGPSHWRMMLSSYSASRPQASHLGPSRGTAWLAWMPSGSCCISASYLALRRLSPCVCMPPGFQFRGTNPRRWAWLQDLSSAIVSLKASPASFFDRLICIFGSHTSDLYQSAAFCCKM